MRGVPATAMAPPPSTASFGDTLLDLLRETAEFRTSMGTPNVAAFARVLDGVHYETLRKVLAGEREPSADLMEKVAHALGVSPEHFVEYRLWVARRQFDVREVGYEQALENLRAWAESDGRKAR